jgi:hypothetical protein
MDAIFGIYLLIEIENNRSSLSGYFHLSHPFHKSQHPGSRQKKSRRMAGLNLLKVLGSIKLLNPHQEPVFFHGAGTLGFFWLFFLSELLPGVCGFELRDPYAKIGTLSLQLLRQTSQVIHRATSASGITHLCTIKASELYQ